MTAPSTPQIPDELRPYLDTIADRLLSGHAAVMVGSGFSKNATSPGSHPGFPDWSLLGDRLYERLHGNPPGPNERYLQVPALAHQVEADFGRPALDQMLRDFIPDLQHEPSPLHEALLDLPWSDVFTTNYDTLLERARRSVISQRYDVVLKPDDLGHSNRPRIVKLHGSFPSDRPFIITDEDYRRYPHEFAPFVNAVRQALLENTLCLIGFSGDDPNFLQWVGWIHDNLGHRNSPKMYLVGLLQLSPSQKTLLERRNITPVDMAVCPDIGRDHYQALRQFLRYLQSRRAGDNQLDWPLTTDEEPPSPDSQEPRKIVEMWTAQRRQYPGWIVLPEDLRSSLWFKTSNWVRKLPSADALPAVLDLEFAFELVWRMERCLCPILDNQISFLEATIDRYWLVTNADATLESLPLDGNDVDARGLTLDAIRYRCHYLLLVMLRHYREEGLSAEWDDACQKIQTVLPTLSPEHVARFHYERALFALFALNLGQLKTRLAEWPRNDALPFWTAKKAGLLAEIGRVNEARHILEQSLDTIRVKLNLTPTRTDYTLVSQESFVMYLLHAVRQASILETSERSDTRRQRRKFRERWHVLKQYKCDPWQEIETFEDKLQRPPATTPDVSEKPTFDIGRSVRTRHMHVWNTEALAAYNFLRFCEDAGIPFRVPSCTIATKSAAGTLGRIAEYSSHLALATLVRIGDVKAVDEIFDRASLARMSTPSVNSLIQHYLESLRLAVLDIGSGDRWRDSNFGTLLAGVLPEILSRLCCKCSRGAREMLLDWLLEVYRSEHRPNYQGIQYVTARLLAAVPVAERIAIVPKLLQFPILTELNPLEEREYLNPFDILDLSKELILDEVTISDTELDVFFDGASSNRPAVRKWAISTLAALERAGLLDRTRSRRFADCLWSRVDEYGLPSDTNYFRFVFLSFPYPEKVDPVERFMQYVRGARFPAEESQTRTAIEFPGPALCHDICAATDVQWPEGDVRSIVRRLVQWWDNDKAHWLRVQVKEPFPSIAKDLGERLPDLIMTLATMVVTYPDSVRDESTRDAVKRVAKECSEYDVPSLRLEVACSYTFAASRDPVLERVKDAMASSCRNAVIDAIYAMNLVSRRTASESEGGDLLELLRAAGQMIRWRRETALESTMGAVGEAVTKHPFAFVDDVESGVLTGLRHLIAETDVRKKNRGGIYRNTGFEDVARKLLLRRAAARLSYELFEHYRAVGDVIPEPIRTWEAVCRSEDEFLEIRNQWLAPQSRT